MVRYHSLASALQHEEAVSQAAGCARSENGGIRQRRRALAMGGGSNEMAWKNYIRWVQGNKQILFYTSPASFDILPTGNMEAAQLAELREMLKTNIHSES